MAVFKQKLSSLLKFSFFFLILFSKASYAADFKLEKILDLKDPWSLTFINKDELLITEKEGEIIYFNINNKTLKKIKHNLNYKVDGQGGLLDILKYKMKYLFATQKIEGEAIPVPVLQRLIFL